MMKSKFSDEFNSFLQLIGGLVVLAAAIAFFEWAKVGIIWIFTWAVCHFLAAQATNESAKDWSLIRLVIGFALTMVSGFIVALFFGRMGLPRGVFIPFSVIYSFVISFATYRIASRIYKSKSIEEQRKIFSPTWIDEFLTEKPTNNYWVLVNFLKHHAIPLVTNKQLVASTLKQAKRKLDWGPWIHLYEAKIIDAVLVLPSLHTTFPLGNIVNLYQHERRVTKFALLYEGSHPNSQCIVVSVDEALYETCKYVRLLALLSVYKERHAPIPEIVESITPGIVESFDRWFESMAMGSLSITRTDEDHYAVN